MELNKIHITSVLKGIDLLDDNSINCVVTSPPYWGLRNYNTEPEIWMGDPNCDHDWSDHIRKPTGGFSDKSIIGSHTFQEANNRSEKYVSQFCNKCNAWKGELGLEPDPKLFIDHLGYIFHKIQPKLRKDATIFINLGDTYSGSQQGFGLKNGDTVGDESKYEGSIRGVNSVQTPMFISGGKPLTASVDGIRKKSLIMIPSRFAIKMIDDYNWILRNNLIWHKPNATPQSVKDRFTNDFESIFFFSINKKYFFNQQFEPYSGEDSIKRMSRKYDSDKVDNIDEEFSYSMNSKNRNLNDKGRNMRSVWSINTKSFKDAHFAVYPEKLVERCIKAGCPIGGTVLDPFMGSGTTAVVAKKLGINYVGIELNPEYEPIQRDRLNILPNFNHI